MAGSSGVPRSGAVVELYDAAGVLVRTTTTDAEGDYAFAKLADGAYTVRVVNSSVTSSRAGYVPGLLPVVVALTCLNGFFHDPGSGSLAAALLTAPTGGAVAVWASAGLTDTTAQAPLGRAFLQRLGAGTGVALGEAARAAKAATPDRNEPRTWVFFGDPALRWVPPLAPPAALR